MNASRITPAFIAPYFIDMELHTLFTPERVRLMVQWVYETHNDFLEDYFDCFDEDGEWTQRMTKKEVIAIQKRKEKMAKDLRNNFPEVKQYNVMYDNILDILKELILEENA